MYLASLPARQVTVVDNIRGLRHPALDHTMVPRPQDALFTVQNRIARKFGPRAAGVRRSRIPYSISTAL